MSYLRHGDQGRGVNRPAFLSRGSNLFFLLDGFAALAQAYAMLFGVVTGMMVFISFSELIPTALQYDPERRYFFLALVTGSQLRHPFGPSRAHSSPRVLRPPRAVQHALASGEGSFARVFQWC